MFSNENLICIPFLGSKEYSYFSSLLRGIKATSLLWQRGQW